MDDLSITSNWMVPVGGHCRAFRERRWPNGTVVVEYCGQQDMHAGQHTPVAISVTATWARPHVVQIGGHR
jgi:hypothetical protein